MGAADGEMGEDARVSGRGIRGEEAADDVDGDKDRERHKETGKHRSKHRDRSREREKEEHRDSDRYDRRDGGRDRRKEERDREKEKSSREKAREKDYDRDGKHREKEREPRDRGKEREGEREREQRDHGREKDKGGRERSKHHESERDERARERDREKGRDREREREREKDQDRLKDKERDNREKERSKNREKERERDKIERENAKEKSRERKDEDQEKDNLREATAPKAPTTELGERLTKIREERTKATSDSASEILAWVTRSRKLEEKRNAEKVKALHLAKALEEQDDILAGSEDDEADGLDRGHLAGVKISHGFEKAAEGAVTLVLKDQSILAGGDINEDVDVLENVEIVEQKQRDEAYKAAKKKTGIYDDKFSDEMGSRRPILPQYDDQIEDEGVTLDESGGFSGEAEKKLEELRRRIAGGSTEKTFEDLTTAGKTSSDYYTAEEMLQFKKPKKKKSLRKKEKLDLDALEAEAFAAGLGAGDLGSRNDPKRQAAREEQERAEAERRSNAYQAAIAKAEEASKVLQQEQTITVQSVSQDEELVFGEDYEDLQRSLEQARRLALGKQDEATPVGPQAVALLATAKKREEESSSIEGEAQENKVVITEMEDFLMGLQLNQEPHKPEAEDVFMDEDDAPEPAEEEAKAEVGGWTEVKEINSTELPVNEEDTDVAPDEIIHEVAVGKGLAGALKLLKERGTLNEGIDLGGRTMDKKKSKLVGIYENEGPKEIRIERTDEFGRIMTPKEAFRMLSHKFHGKGPGKMKQEKRMKKYQEDLKTKQMKASDTPLLAMEKMREAQAKMKTPYLVLSGHVKPGQTSDPRSGFATVEKDHLGSLTPMLGDKKVEHFLGIKRSAEAGSMGPPPPKKPKN